jgi:hypothetical protein
LEIIEKWIEKADPIYRIQKKEETIPQDCAKVFFKKYRTIKQQGRRTNIKEDSCHLSEWIKQHFYTQFHLSTPIQHSTIPHPQDSSEEIISMIHPKMDYLHLLLPDRTQKLRWQ